MEGVEKQEDAGWAAVAEWVEEAIRPVGGSRRRCQPSLGIGQLRSIRVLAIVGIDWISEEDLDGIANLLHLVSIPMAGAGGGGGTGAFGFGHPRRIPPHDNMKRSC